MAGRGNPGYGKMEMIRTNVDKFSPKFWELMGIYADSRDVEKEQFFMTEFNKIQSKMIPQLVGNDPENPIFPIYGGTSVQVQGHDGDQKDIPAQEEN